MDAADRIQAAAEKLMKDSDGLTIEAARSKVRKQHPDWRDEERAIARGEWSPSTTDTPTISERIAVVKQRAVRDMASFPWMVEYPKTSREEILAKAAAEWWRTPGGQLLRDLDRAQGGRPYSPQAIRKHRMSERHGEALKLLQ